MNFLLERVSGPEIEPVTVAEMIQQVREFSSISQATQDELGALIVAAREWVEDSTGRALIDQTWRLTVGDYVNVFANVDSDTVSGCYRGAWVPRADGSILLRKSPVLAITSFVSVDAAGAETAIAPSTYALREADSKWPSVVALNGGSWNSGTLRITFRAGFADRLGSPQEGADVVPVRFKQAIKLWAEGHYDRDEKLIALAESLIEPESANLRLA